MVFYQAAQQEISLVIDFSSNSEELWVLFGGINGGLGVPIFEFGNITKDIDVKKIFIRDRYQAFYHKGLENVDGVNDVKSIRNYLNELICESNAKKVVFLGNSAGGYAAILFGVLLQVDSVYAFSPPTLLRKKDCLMVSTVSEKVTPESWEIIEKAETSDLCSFLKKNNSDHTKIHIFFDETSEDCAHAYRINSFRNIIFHVYQEGGHELIKCLKRNGELTKILHEI